MMIVVLGSHMGFFDDIQRLSGTTLFIGFAAIAAVAVGALLWRAVLRHRERLSRKRAAIERAESLASAAELRNLAAARRMVEELQERP